MISNVHMAKSFQFQLQRKMQVISSNIANIQSPGYRMKVVQMESTLPWGDIEEVISKNETREDFYDLFRKKTVYPEYGQAVRILEVQRKTDQGTLEVTNRDLDLAIVDGDGLFQVSMPNGSTAYTRAGNFKLNEERYITDQNGHYVEPRIQLPEETSSVFFSAEGQVLVNLHTDPRQREIGQLTLATFKRPEELRDIGQNLYTETPYSEEPIVQIPGEQKTGRIKQRVLELSNVSIIDQMMEMLFTQRQFHLIVGAQDAVIGLLKTGADLKL
jgi:flagellar basal-body rod protein FlgG